MKESDLYRPLKRWLKSRGFSVYPEVPFKWSPIDIVAARKGHLVGLEMKLSLSHKVIRQASRLQLYCNEAYVAIASEPKDLSRATRFGLGVLRVTGRDVLELASPASKGKPNPNYHEMLLELLHNLDGKGVGGVPCQDGVGPAQDCKRRVDRYRAAHPDATWDEVFRNVPNHYAHARSMMGALTTGIALRARWKKILREERISRIAAGR